MTIRDAALSDATAISQLTSELGYAASTEEIADRLSRAVDRRKQIVLVADVEEKIAGWIQVQAAEVLESGLRAEIVGLVVAERCR